ncbi:glycosyl hydrolase family 61-domain-containing protein [Cristinia sonorae]|uniref:AA9 family lytic polysaccharide monooxygenase n=1 Tax=Cristinia sonorae TaxID=1940300 RepID=A0A8K0UUI8_9AGAR|nr:glycosyl hydrolase family 61-domain-containing protein [Cristinia sonorae]
MFAFATLVAFASTALPQALAHGGILSYSNAGNWYKGGANPYNSPTGQTSIQPQVLSAGSDITAYWNQNLSHDTSPMLTYLAKCPGNPSSCDDVSSNTLKWFKIDEAGLLSGTVASGKWAAGAMIDQNFTWTTTIPSTVPSGNYFIRFETIALHSMPAVQFYPECAQIEITGGGNRAPTTDELVTFPGGYVQSDSGRKSSLNHHISRRPHRRFLTEPALAPAPHPTHIPAASAPEKTSAPMTSAPRPTTTTVVNQFAQCGGIDFTGPTTCASGFT